MYNVEFTPDSSFPGATDEKASGPWVSDFDATPIGTFGDQIQGSEQLISLCLPNVSFEQFNTILWVKLDKDNPFNVDNPNDNVEPFGWIFYVPQEGGGLAKYHATYEEGNPDEIVYRRWLPCEGIWGPEIDAPQEIPQMDLISAMIDILVNNGHLTLDLIGLIPVYGEAADVINGIWYLYEGNIPQAVLSVAATTPVIGVIVTSSKYVFKIVIKGVGGAADKVGDLSKFVKKYVDETGTSKLLKIGPPGNETELIGDWVGIQTYAKGLTPDQAKRFADWFLNNTDINLLKTIGANEELITVWKNLDEVGGSANDAQRLFSKLASDGSDDLVDFFKNNPTKVNGWKLLSDSYPNAAHKRLWDENLIKSTADALDDTEFMGVLTTYTDDAIATLSNIITKNNKAVCCGNVINSGNVHLSPIDNYLDNVKSLLKSMENNNVSGVKGFIGNITSSNLNLIDEGNQLARLSGSQPPNPAFNMSLYADFNKTFTTSSKRFDLRKLFNPNIGKQYAELKSWGNVAGGNPNSISNNLIGNSSYGQYTEYLKNVDNLESLRYSFDIGKITPQISDYPNLPLSERQTRVVWDQWKIFYNTKAASLFTDLGATKFMQLFGVNTVDDFLDIVNTPINDIANPTDLYKYIKIE